MVQVQEQQECFLLSSKINDTVYTAPSEGICSITATSSNSALESS